VEFLSANQSSSYVPHGPLDPCSVASLPDPRRVDDKVPSWAYSRNVKLSVVRNQALKIQPSYSHATSQASVTASVVSRKTGYTKRWRDKTAVKAARRSKWTLGVLVSIQSPAFLWATTLPRPLVPPHERCYSLTVSCLLGALLPHCWLLKRPAVLGLALFPHRSSSDSCPR